MNTKADVHAFQAELLETAPASVGAKIVVRDRHVIAAGSLLLLLPNILFALRLQPLPAVIMLAGALLYVALTKAPGVATPSGALAQPVALPRLGACMALAFALLILGGEGHLFFSNWDWLWRDAVLADVGRGPFPPTYQVGGEAFFLRAPLGMYMLPALVAKAAGLGASHAALLVQNGIFLTLVLYMLATIAGRRALPVLVVFVSFSGLDVLGVLVMWLKTGHGIATFALPSHIENWTLFQYSSVMTQLFWVPNHALPAYWLTILVMLCARREVTIGELGLAMAASLFWSPFAFIGTLPLAAYLFVKGARTTILDVRFWIAGVAALCFLPVALYLKADAAEVPHAFILFEPMMATTIALFLMIEIPHVAVVRHVWDELDPVLRPVLLVSILFLAVLPTVVIGVADDLVMRASIPSLTILAFFFAQTLCVAWETRRRGVFVAGLAIMLIGAVTPAQEIIRSLTFPSYAISDCNIVTVWQKIWAKHPTIENYLAHQSQSPAWLMAMPKGTPLVDRPESTCWGHLPYPPQSNVSTMSNDKLRHASDGGGDSSF